jgi:hypothetical protein
MNQWSPCSHEQCPIVRKIFIANRFEMNEASMAAKKYFRWFSSMIFATDGWRNKFDMNFFRNSSL